MKRNAAVSQRDPGSAKSGRKRSRKRWLFIGITLAVLLWCGIDLYGPHNIDIRNFDADEVARLDNGMWRSYYSKERVKLFFQLAELMRVQFHFPFLKSHVVAYKAAKAAFVFKKGHNRADYEKALPDLIDFYTAIRKVSITAFDENRTALLELEWWIIHRQRHNHVSGDLERALAETSAELYRVPVERFTEYARLRTEAMIIRDKKAIAGGVTEEDWVRIEDLLRASWRSLSEAVRQ